MIRMISQIDIRLLYRANRRAESSSPNERIRRAFAVIQRSTWPSGYATDEFGLCAARPAAFPLSIGPQVELWKASEAGRTAAVLPHPPRWASCVGPLGTQERRLVSRTPVTGGPD